MRLKGLRITIYVHLNIVIDNVCKPVHNQMNIQIFQLFLSASIVIHLFICTLSHPQLTMI